ncbi:MAG: hypothetical protein FWD69_01605 [Polyangiaceae bacterium]|nr:hypothetical protein [Polyangiaceae bacterium]
MSRAYLPIAMVTAFVMMACHHEGGSQAPISSNAITSKNLGAATTPGETRSISPDGGIMSSDAGMVKTPVDARSVSSDGGVDSLGVSTHATADDVIRQAKQELAACGAYNRGCEETCPEILPVIQVDRQHLMTVSNWIETYRVVMGNDAEPEVTSNSAAKSALCAANPDFIFFHEGACNNPGGAFFWTQFPEMGESYAIQGIEIRSDRWDANIIVRLKDGTFALVEAFQHTSFSTVGCGYASDKEHVTPIVRFERGKLIHVRARYGAVDYRGCSVSLSQVDIFVDPTTGDQVFYYFQQSQGDDKPFPPIQSVSIVDNQAILTGPQCHVAIRLPAKNETK